MLQLLCNIPDITSSYTRARANEHQQIQSSCNPHANASVGTALVHVVASLCITLYDGAVRIYKTGANIHRC